MGSLRSPPDKDVKTWKTSEYCIPANTYMLADAAMPAERQKCTNENMAEGLALRVRVATFLRNKYVSITYKADIFCQNCPDFFYFIVLDIFLTLTID